MDGRLGAKASLLGRIDEEWQELLQVIGRISADEQQAPNAVGHWSAKELLIHLVAWNIELESVIQRFRNHGEEAGYGDDEAVDRLNDAQVQEKQHLSVSQVWDELLQSYRRLGDFLQQLPDDDFAPETYTRAQIKMESVDHYSEHRRDLENWLENRLTK